jgi:hypothetical protein
VQARLHDMLAAAAAELRTHMTDHHIGGWNPLQHLRDDLAQPSQLASALWAGFVRGQMRVHFARQMFGQSTPVCCRRSVSRRRSSGVAATALGPRALQLFQAQFELFDLTADLL